MGVLPKRSNPSSGLEPSTTQIHESPKGCDSYSLLFQLAFPGVCQDSDAVQHFSCPTFCRSLWPTRAFIDHVRSLVTPTPKGDCFSAAIVSDGSYGVPKGLVSSFPLHSKGDGAFQIVPNVPLDEFAKGKIAATIAELEKERDLVKDLLGS